MTADESGCSSIWSREQNRAFENALAIHAEGSSDRWEKIVADVPGKTLEQIQHHYKLLKEDLLDIESGRVSLPCYIYSSDGSTSHGDDEASGLKKGNHFDADSSHVIRSSRSDLDRRKGIAWTEDEHRLFLLGLDKYGKGDWRSISRNFVVTRTPTQVASHAQKYFIRMNSMNKDRRRSSIHDITSIDNAETSGTPQGPITGQSNGGGSPRSSNKSAALRAYAPTSLGQLVGSAVGTPVNFPVYGMRGPPIVGPVVSGSPMAYRVPHPSAHR